jgi:ureidoacrylate peracid hydrolase
VTSDIADPYSDRALFGRDLHLDPASTAVLVIDMLNDFCVEPGPLANPAALELCPAQNAVLQAIRSSGGTVVFINEQHRTTLQPVREFAKRMTHTYEGSWGAQVVADLPVMPGDLTVLKRRYSGFFASDLDVTLRDRGIRSVVLMGVLTNICVRATAHDSFFLGYDTVVPRDCVGAMSVIEQQATLYDIATHFGWVTDAPTVVQALTTGAAIRNEVPDLSLVS